MKSLSRNIVLSLFSTIAFLLPITLFKNIFDTDIDYSVFYNMNVLAMSVFFIGFMVIYKKYSDKVLPPLYKLLAILFAIFMVIGEIYSENVGLSLITTNLVTFLITIMKLIGFSMSFSIFFKIAFSLKIPKAKWSIKIKNPKIKKFMLYFDKHPFITSALVLLGGWAIYLIAFYPIVLSPDPSFQIRQYFNVPTKYINWVIQIDPQVYMTSHHPVLQTFLLGWSIELGRFLIDDNFGLFIYTAVQTLCYVSVLAYTIVFAKKNQVSNNWCLALLLMYLLVPMYPFYTICAVKDTPYTLLMILFVLFIFDFVKNYTKEKISWPKLVAFFLIMLFMSLFRHNGFYIILIILPILGLYLRKNCWRFFISFAFLFGCIYGFNNYLVPSLGISGSSIREMLSIPFQQTARYVKYYGDELSDTDKKTIDYLLKYDTLATRYDPNLSDNVKNEYNKYATSTDLKAYFKVWFKGLIKHPVVYIDATLNNTYGYIYPNAHNWYIYASFDKRVRSNHLVKYSYNKLEGLRDWLAIYGNVFPYLPVIGVLSNIGFNTWWLLILLVYLINSKKKKYLIVLGPLILSVLICIISPANTYFRYTMPYIYLLPVISLLLMKEVRGYKNER